MKFQTPAFVRVENPQERKELIEWLVGIGYDSETDDPLTTIIAVSFSVIGNRNRIYLLADFALPSSQAMMAARDCGTNTDLFKALAAMNDENDSEQWFVTNNDEWFVSGYDKQHRHACNRTIDGMKIGVRTVRKATAEEIIDHFKNQKS